MHHLASLGVSVLSVYLPAGTVPCPTSYCSHVTRRRMGLKRKRRSLKRRRSPPSAGPLTMSMLARLRRASSAKSIQPWCDDSTLLH